MPDLTKRQLAICGLALLGLVVLAVLYSGRGDGVAASPPGGAAPALSVRGADAGGAPVVHVAGAVRAPGVYRLRAGARVGDAVRRAGGARRRADLSAVNLAAEVQDGRQVLVPLRAPGGAPVAGGAPAPGVPLDLNTATLEQLDELDGIGPSIAQQIVDYREANGGFGSVDELDQVPGIGETRLAALREKVRV